MSNEPTYAQIANDWNLWAEYVDPDATMTEAGFDALTISEKVTIQTDCFGAEACTAADNYDGPVQTPDF